jgi:hypothetical protein
MLDLDDVFDFEHCGPDTIAFKNIHNTHCVTPIMEFFRLPWDVHVTRCHLDPRYNCEDNLSMSLKEIDIGEDLVGFLADCVAEKLVINGCPGFDDEVLIAMMTPKSPPVSQRVPVSCRCAPYVQDLSIRNCPNFSHSALKQLVETRSFYSNWGEEYPIAKNYSRTPSSPMRALQLSGRVPHVSSEDREWFEGRLSEFSYDPVQ